MSLHVSFHGLARAEAHVLKSETEWITVVNLYDKEGGEIVVFTKGNATQVEALRAAFDMVDTMKAALKKVVEDNEGVEG